MADKEKWITVNGTPVPLDEEGNLKGKIGGKIEHEAELSQKRQDMKNALQEIANGKEEVTLPQLRNDLEKYGGTNDVTLVKGDEKKGILHIINNGREHYLGNILDAVIEGEIVRTSPERKTVTVKKDNYEAVLSLNRRKEKITWLITGWDITADPKEEKREYLKKKGLASDEQGKVRARHLPTQSEPICSRLCLGADESLKEIITKLKKKSTMNKNTIIFDSKSKRSFDRNGFMHVECSNLTKESVDPYYGYEIVNSEALGFEPDKIYFGYRKGTELAKAAKTFNGLPLMREHHFDSAEKEPFLKRFNFYNKIMNVM